MYDTAFDSPRVMTYYVYGSDAVLCVQFFLLNPSNTLYTLHSTHRTNCVQNTVWGGYDQ